ncbi:UDP-N-acetylmuramoyl-L-alanine--D-glutamate ligase [Selenomonas sp. AB3002]|uniref:UDP-N-acetylmuramoyl-L-alanine--D-glutamate ligase n=1 Tax=Selenomonas sp. AB3002 TaxID=1392502 RepID=UPI000497B760
MELELAGKKVLVIGAGISGFAAAKVAKRFGAEVTLSDAKQEADLKYDFAELRTLGVELAFGPQQEEMLAGVDMVIVSPAVPVRVPIIKAAYDKGIRVLSEVEMAYELAQSPFASVTGTNGKTTTVTLLGELLAAHFPAGKTGVGGNIGIPLVEEALRVGEGGAIAAEISSYQMEATEDFHPHVAAVLNVTPDHIVRHGSMEVYQAMKERMFAQQTAEDFLVLNYDDSHTRGMAERAHGKVCYFSRKEELQEGAYVRQADNRLVIIWAGNVHELCTVEELGIKGGHNVENALAAAASAFLMGATVEEMVPVLKAFKGVEHRIEPVRELDGVAYYNDSKATNTDSAIKALETFPGHIILLAGGDDKLTDLTEFMGLVKERCDELILLGAAAERFQEEAIKNGYPKEHIHMVGFSMEEAVATAHKLAKAPQVVLLSPACASFDMYEGFEARGRDFKRLVNDLR